MMTFFHVLHQFELPLIQVIQTLRSSSLDQVFLYLKVLGSFPPYFIILAIVWHFCSSKKAVVLVSLQSVGVQFYVTLKTLLNQPRPYDLMPSLLMEKSSTCGFPSAAAVASFVTFGYLIVFIFEKKVLKYMALFLILLIGFMRIYLGAHFISDVLGGWLIGAFILFSYDCLSKYLKENQLKLVSQKLLFYGVLPIIVFQSLFFSMHLAVMMTFFLSALLGYQLFRHQIDKSHLVSFISCLIGLFTGYYLLGFIAKIALSEQLRLILSLLVASLMGFWIPLTQKYVQIPKAVN